MSVEEDVRGASARFYAALTAMLNGDATPMGDAWAQDAGVTTMHPIGGRETGWGEVGASWSQVAQLCTGGNARIDDALIRVVGDVGWETGVEHGRMTLAGRQLAIEHRVTNVYRRTADGWKLVHHHADIAPAMQDALRDLQDASP